VSKRNLGGFSASASAKPGALTIPSFSRTPAVLLYGKISLSPILCANTRVGLSFENLVGLDLKRQSGIANLSQSSGIKLSRMHKISESILKHMTQRNNP
jgi:hypothetical protein